MDFTVIIPARYGASRLPGKPLLPIGGKPLLRHVWEASCASGAVRVLIATDDERIRDAAMGFSAEVVMTAAEHASGTDRIAEVARSCKLPEDSVIINVQGDEYGLPPALINQLAELKNAYPDAEIATLYERMDATAAQDPNTVKLVQAEDGKALYFSRAAIPWGAERNIENGSSFLRHIGLYAYTGASLQAFTQLPRTPLERSEGLEQLRALAQGWRIQAALAETPAGIGIDTAEDLRQVEAYHAAAQRRPAPQ
ncbi:MAG: 3-deoxy-manno-octulosonate cytidylyltransferase [Candidatus Eutrophobiaceae bacterium]